MIRFYSVFVSCDEIMQSPFMRDLSEGHDLTLRLGETEHVNFLLQFTMQPRDQERLSIIYEPELLHLTRGSIEVFAHQTLVSLQITPREIGSMKIGFTFPTPNQNHPTSHRAVKDLYLDSKQKLYL